MPRSKEPCEYCESEGSVCSEDAGNLTLMVEIYPMNEFIDISLTGLTESEQEVEINYEIPMHYCPNCGRKLGYG